MPELDREINVTKEMKDLSAGTSLWIINDLSYCIYLIVTVYLFSISDHMWYMYVHVTDYSG